MISVHDDVVLFALEKGLLSSEAVAAARTRLAEQSSPAPTSWQVLESVAGEQTVDFRRLARLLAEEAEVPLVDLKKMSASAPALALVPRAVAERDRVLPLVRDKTRLIVAVCDPLDFARLDALAYLTQLDLVCQVAPADDLRDAIGRFYGVESDGRMADHAPEKEPSPGEFRVSESSGEKEAPAETEEDAPIIALVQTIIQNAIERRASDIHFEPLPKRFRVRYRIDGVLLEVENPPQLLQRSIISRIKIMANLSIAEKRVPQDGRIQITVTDRSWDFRVSSLPTVHGESIVMRVLDPSGLRLGLPELGFFADDQQAFERLLALPDGMLLVTGPTGSGKTTTLYSCLHHLNQPDRKIITVEDPVEYQLTGVNQVPVRSEIGMTFASALRAMLRQSPNVVMVGEIRDAETAEIAINASLTGHLVFSTLHTNDAAGAVSRLLDIGVKPFLVATSLRVVLAQRLVRRICAHCCYPSTPSPHELRALGITPAQAEGATFGRGRGCPACHGTGYCGRVGIFELLVLDEEIRAMIYAQASAAKIREKACRLGLRSMREDGARKVTAGLTTAEEVVSITVGDLS